MANRRISEGRQAIYYVGVVLAVIGALTFFSVFVTAAMSFGDFGHSDNISPFDNVSPFDNFDGFGNTDSFDSFAQKGRSEAVRAVTGIGLIAVGMILMGIGSRGLAGSGVILDPEQAREDMEPWSRMAGGMIGDAIDEADIQLGNVLNRDDDNEMPFDERLRRLHQLYTDGILTEEEYQREKQKILDQG